jgi:SAM-dependent MidA family methyltransferase
LSAAGPYLLALQDELGGSIPFERFMREALYNPNFGYYTTGIRSVGRRGDFSTMATLDQSLAKAIAAWIRETKARDVIEIGAGNGQLAHDVLKALGWWRRWSIRYHIVEVSGPLRAIQQKLLRGRNVVWHDSPRAALLATGGVAAIFSNELPDAFPCRIFEKTSEGWRELHLRIEKGAFHERLQPGVLPESSAFDCPGQRVEVHESYHQWLREWAPAWKSGTMLTIDYGDTIDALYHRRPRGSMRGYAHHQCLTGAEILQAPGRMDLTADVNFTDLQHWGEAFGWKTKRNSTLTEFLPEDTRSEFREASKAFRVLEQTR